MQMSSAAAFHLSLDMASRITRLEIVNFTARDIAATSVAFVLLGLILIVPGYVVGALLDFFGFARRSLPARFAIAICSGVAIVPILTYLNWRYVPVAPWAVCAAACVAFPVIVARRSHRQRVARRPLTKQRKAVLAIATVWVAVGMLCLADVQIGHRLYFHVASYDYTLRVAFTAAIARTGVPPLNPYYHPGHAYPMRYHYFWFMLCALATKFGGPAVTPRIAVMAGTLWSGVALMAVVSLYIQIFGARMSESRDRQMLVAIGLLGVAGLDIIPIAITFLISKMLPASSDWWNEIVPSWLNSVFWHPHSIAALVAGATGLLVGWDGVVRQERSRRIGAAAICGAAMASALGLSIYVALVFAVVLAVWTVVVAVRKGHREAVFYCAAGIIALVFSAAYVLDLHGDTAAGAKFPIRFAVRSFFVVEDMMGSGAPRWHLVLGDLLALPLNYFLEFGFFFIVGIAYFRRVRARGGLSDEEAFGIVVLGTSLIVCTFFRSSAIASNDLGWRGITLAQFMLLLWAAWLWDDGLFPAHRKWRSAAAVILILGATATLYDMTLLRIYPVMLDDLAMPRVRWLAPDHKLGERTYALRSTYEALDRMLPERAILQQNPEAYPGDLFKGLYANRQTVVDGKACDAVFGGPAALCPATLAAIDPLFSASARLSYAQVQAICRQHSIDAVVVKDTDGVWSDKDSWVWNAQPVIANGYSRAFLCGVVQNTRAE
jgi:hypothetical protein